MSVNVSPEALQSLSDADKKDLSAFVQSESQKATVQESASPTSPVAIIAH
jgi:hypothetical protein